MVSMSSFVVARQSHDRVPRVLEVEPECQLQRALRSVQLRGNARNPWLDFPGPVLAFGHATEHDRCGRKEPVAVRLDQVESRVIDSHDQVKSVCRVFVLAKNSSCFR